MRYEVKKVWVDEDLTKHQGMKTIGVEIKGHLENCVWKRGDGCKLIFDETNADVEAVLSDPSNFVVEQTNAVVKLVKREVRK